MTRAISAIGHTWVGEAADIEPGESARERERRERACAHAQEKREREGCVVCVTA